MTQVQDTFDEIRDQGLLEDRREYTQEDLERMYGLTGQQTEELYQMIQREFEPKHPASKLDRAGVVAALKASGYDTDADIKTAKFRRMSLNEEGVAHYEVTYHDDDDGPSIGTVFIELDGFGRFKGEF